MTKDGRFKREVRRLAQASGEPYTRARARLDEARRSPLPTDVDEPLWIVLYSFAGVEDWLRRWLLSNFAAGLGRILVPRYQGGPIVPGMLLLEVTRDAGLADLLELPFFTDYLGAPAEPTRLTWEEVREVLRNEGTRTRNRLVRPGLVGGGRAQVPVKHAEAAEAAGTAPEGGAEEVGAGAEDPGAGAEDEYEGRVPEESPYDRPGRFPRVIRASDSEERQTQQLLQRLLDGPTEGERAKAKAALVLAHDSMVEHIAARFIASSPLAQAELREAGRHGLSHAVESFHPVCARTPPPGCRRVDFRSYAAWCVRRSVVRRISQPG